MDHTTSFVLFHFLGEIVMNPEDGVTFISGNTKSFTIPNNISLHELKEVIGS